MVDVEDGVFHEERELEEQDINTCLLVSRDRVLGLKNMEYGL